MVSVYDQLAVLCIKALEKFMAKRYRFTFSACFYFQDASSELPPDAEDLAVFVQGVLEQMVSADHSLHYYCGIREILDSHVTCTCLVNCNVLPSAAIALSADV
jgi:hypothetical protein